MFSAESEEKMKFCRCFSDSIVVVAVHDVMKWLKIFKNLFSMWGETEDKHHIEIVYF